MAETKKRENLFNSKNFQFNRQIIKPSITRLTKHTTTTMDGTLIRFCGFKSASHFEKFETGDYVSETTPCAKFRANPFIGGFPANGWNITNFFI